jgi:hypothetical protein
MNQCAELCYLSVAHRRSEACHHPPVQATHQFGVMSGKVGERAVSKGHDGGFLIGPIADQWIKSESIEIADQRFKTRGRITVGPRPPRAFFDPDLFGISPTGSNPCRHRKHH